MRKAVGAFFLVIIFCISLCSCSGKPTENPVIDKEYERLSLAPIPILKHFG